MSTLLTLVLLVACGRGPMQPCPLHPATDLGGGPVGRMCEARK